MEDNAHCLQIDNVIACKNDISQEAFEHSQGKMWLSLPKLYCLLQVSTAAHLCL